MKKRILLLPALLALATSCADDIDPTQIASELDVAGTCSSAGPGDLTNDDSNLLFDGELLANVTCTNYDDPRIYGTLADLAAFLDDSCTVTLGSIPHDGECDTSQPPVVIDETADTVTIARCVDACSGNVYTAEGGTWVEVPDIDVFNYSCETTGEYAGCCDYYGVTPSQLNACDRVWSWNGFAWADTLGTIATLSTGVDIGFTARRAPLDPTTTPHLEPAAIAQEGIPPPRPVDPRRAQLMANIRALVAALAFAGVPYHTELGEQLQKMAEQARDLAENKGQQRLEIQVMPKPVARGPLNPGPNKGIIVMPGGRPGTSRPPERPPGIEPPRPGLPPGPTRPPVEPPKGPKPPGGIP